MKQEEIVIGGAGIVGLATALELARAGFQVRVLERGRPMRESSWAAAGMLAAQDPENPPELESLAMLSRKLYPDFLAHVEHLSGMRVKLRTAHALQASAPGRHFHLNESPSRSYVTAAEAKRRIPGLEPGSRSLMWLEEASLDPRDLCQALPAAARAAGVLLEEENEVLSVEAKSGRIQIATAKGAREAGAFVNCCGSWSNAIRGAFPADGMATIEPRKGQMAAVSLENGAALDVVVRTPSLYLVPRGDGRVIVGATVERAGFDRGVDAAVVGGLISRAAEIWPPIGEARVLDRWAGFRPGTADDLPVIGSSRVSGCFLATGHFRNGILLAPVTARVIRQLIEGDAPEVPLERFTPNRPQLARDAANGGSDNAARAAL